MNYLSRQNPPEPHEHPLRSLQLDSLSELRFSRDDSLEAAHRTEFDQGEAATS